MRLQTCISYACFYLLLLCIHGYVMLAYRSSLLSAGSELTISRTSLFGLDLLTCNPLKCLLVHEIKLKLQSKDTINDK